MSEIRPRITGTEMEWAVFTRKKGDTYFSQASESTVKAAIKSLRPDLKIETTNGMLSNGGRLYKDVGNHPEYATPEETSFYGTVVNEFAGEQIVRDAFANVQNPDYFDDFIVNKRVVDDELETWGYHISLLADAKKLPISIKNLAPLGIHLSTMGIFTGAGAVIPTTENSVMFTVTQKSLNLNTDFSGTSHGKTNPLISVRAESLAESSIFSRVHITSLDANMSPWATWMKLGTTSIVLRMMEHGYLSQEPYFGIDMHRVALSVAYDSAMKHSVDRADGSSILPLDVQIGLIEIAEKLQKNEGLPDEENDVLAEWKRVLHDLQRDPELAVDRVEWIRKRSILRAYMGRHALNYCHPTVKNLDRSWSTIDPDSIGMRLRHGAWSKWNPSQEQVNYAYTNPPESTRAFGRAALIRSYGQSQRHNFTATWDNAVLANRNKEWFMFDPYETYTEPVAIKQSKNSYNHFIGPHQRTEDDDYESASD